MKCPNCKSEVLNEPICPYCGTMVAQTSNTPGQFSHTQEDQQKNAVKGLLHRIKALETKLSIVIALLCGLLAMVVLILLVLVLK